MSAKMAYVIKFVSNMDRAIRFYRDTLDLALKFQSPEWSEFATGDTVLALHPASTQNPAGSIQLGFHVEDPKDLHEKLLALGVSMSREPQSEGGAQVSEYRDLDGAKFSVSSSH